VTNVLTYVTVLVIERQSTPRYESRIHEKSREYPNNLQLGGKYNAHEDIAPGAKSGDKLFVMLNGAGAATLMELYIIFRRVKGIPARQWNRNRTVYGR